MPGFVGPQTRGMADQLEAQRLANFSSHIRPGVTIRIERTRPPWCAGYLEDYPIEDDAESMAELRAYVRDEYGGARYRLTVVSSNGVELAEGSFPVAAPPRERGRLIDRQRWEGNLEPRAVAAPAQAAESQEQRGITALMLELMKDTNRATIESVKEMTRQTRDQTSDLVKAVVATKSEERRERSIATQLGEIVETTRALDKVQRQLFGAARNGKAEDPDAAAEREARSFFNKAVMSKIFEGNRPPPPQQSNGAAQRPPAQRRPQQRIPDAQPK